MSARLFYTIESPPEQIEELTSVRLRRPVDVAEARQTLPIGARGTIVSVLGGGAAYIIEFADPFPALVDLAAVDFEVIPGESRDDLVAGRLAHRAS